VLAVVKAKNSASRTFFKGVLMFYLRHIPRTILTQIKNAPNKPHITPKKIPAGRSRIEFSLATERFPSLSEPESDKLKGAFVAKESNIDRTNVEIEVAANTLHNMLKVQNVFGLDISYINNDPPIGAPKATATPHPAPHAIIYRL